MTGAIPSFIVLGVVLAAALGLTFFRPSPANRSGERAAAAKALLLATMVQIVHFGEETMTGFPEHFPKLFGMPPMSFSFYIVVNVTLIAIWLISVADLRSNKKPAFAAAWFLGIAGVLNGIAHPAFAFVVGGYFPGLVSAPFAGAICIWLLVMLNRAVRRT